LAVFFLGEAFFAAFLGAAFFAAFFFAISQTPNKHGLTARTKFEVTSANPSPAGCTSSYPHEEHD
jgi:hypothetical protein